MKTEKAYNIWANKYDLNPNKTRDLDQISTREILKRYEFRNVLELGCGTGKNTEFLLEKAKFLIGLDFSDEMLKIARQKIQDSRVQFKKVDLNNSWDMESKSFDLVTSSLTIEHIQDLDSIFTKANHVLVNEGLFFISELHPFKQCSGSGARFERDQKSIELQTFTHHTSDYIGSAKKNGFELVELQEWFDEDGTEKIPRLISFVFRKN